MTTTPSNALFTMTRPALVAYAHEMAQKGALNLAAVADHILSAYLDRSDMCALLGHPEGLADDAVDAAVAAFFARQSAKAAFDATISAVVYVDANWLAHAIHARMPPCLAVLRDEMYHEAYYLWRDACDWAKADVGKKNKAAFDDALAYRLSRHPWGMHGVVGMGEMEREARRAYAKHHKAWAHAHAQGDLRPGQVPAGAF